MLLKCTNVIKIVFFWWKGKTLFGPHELFLLQGKF